MDTTIDTTATSSETKTITGKVVIKRPGDFYGTTQHIREKFYKEWWWLVENHEWLPNGLSIDVQKVNPKNHRIDDDETKNTLIEFWLEGGPMAKVEEVEFPVRSHDYKLDCGAETFEEAVVKFAKLVKKHYGSGSDLYGKQSLLEEKKSD